MPPRPTLPQEEKERKRERERERRREGGEAEKNTRQMSTASL
jgi:hypothetical protein